MTTQSALPSSTETLPSYEIVNFSYGAGTEAELTILCYGKRFHITVSANNLKGDSNATKEYLSLLEKLNSGEPHDRIDDEGDPMEELCFWIAFRCNPHMRALTSKRPQRMQTLHDWFHPDTLVLTPKDAPDGILHVYSSTPSPQLLQELTPSVELSGSIVKHGIPVVPPSKILLPQNTAKDFWPQRPAKVFTESGMARFFKPAHLDEHADREIQTLLRLQELGLTETIRAPRLLEIVEAQEGSSRISGILLEYIEHRDSLGYVDVLNTPLSTRMKWANQVQEMITVLHAAGIVWGDAKPDNILVDADENLWIIDFGGGYTHGWVEKENEESVEGDMQALSRIADFLLVTKSE
ncbi:uncharacterized protein BO97DRAFT_347904 [Aspergillus homomorphus CBS 101889]|uniref:Protein kinase domain-containing protein n=1 Tax=Aspergillus homomorphus (strain CBS 101889) TaxID=1450537 RepID=A0A395HUV8_ASPHC|nr:hypothetical protein BO97DRAFT_347904 [Aspergillus homomorphus CBS 101889]RAL11203.1 hypothetical protein BO97DRAFT_347904 [Aspergillus homomorphus CBS 101889]